MRPITELSFEEQEESESAEIKTSLLAQKVPTLYIDYEKLVVNSRSYLSNMAYKFAEVATNIMSTSKGRNKLCSLIQYQAKLIYTCTINSNITDVQNMIL